MKNRKFLILLPLVLLLLFWLWPRPAMPDMEGMKNLAVTVIDYEVIQGVPYSDTRQYALEVGSPAYAELKDLLENTRVHRSLRGLWQDGSFRGGDHIIMLLGGESVILSDGRVLIGNHLYSGYRPGTGAALADRIAALLADEPQSPK